jgi:maltooligosyltrehalose trehalohydrolase
MARLRVWAPYVEKIELEADGTVFSMHQEERGWWSVETPLLVHGADYGCRIDGEGPFPDPRSPWQPYGVHGMSRWLDHSRFEWTDAHWQPPPLSSAVIYELHIGTFSSGGTFDTAIEQLGHLVDLGVTHIELMPVAQFSGTRGWGYDGVDLYAPHQAYGGPEGLKRLIDACHRRGLAILLDVVYNHFGPTGNYLSRFGPYLTDRYVTPWGDAVNLDGPGSNEVRRFFIDNALMWLRDYHVDGLRIDAVHAIIDVSAVHFLEQLAYEVKVLEAHLGRHLTLIAESDLNNPRIIQPPEVGGYGIRAQWNEDFHHALHAALTGERTGYYQDFGRLADLAKVLTQGFVYDGGYSVYRGRHHGRSASALPGDRFVGFLQNHDQIGNRALGERASALLDEGQLMIAAALILTSPFIPMLFQGEEWAASSPFLYFTDHEEPELAEAVRQGRRTEFASFGWNPEQIPDPQAQETFRRSKLDWSEQTRGRHSRICAWHRRLIALRRTTPALTDGRLASVQVRFDEDARWLILRRGPVLVVCNFSERPQRVFIGAQLQKAPFLTSHDEIALEKDALSLPGHAVAVFNAMGV